MNTNKPLPMAVFFGMLVVFLYLILTPALAVGGLQFNSLFGAVFNFGLSADFISAIAFRVALLFFGAFSLAWLALSLLSTRKA